MNYSKELIVKMMKIVHMNHMILYVIINTNQIKKYLFKFQVRNKEKEKNIHTHTYTSKSQYKVFP